MAKINAVRPVLSLFFSVLLASLMGVRAMPTHAANQTIPFGSGTAIIGDEVYGLAGPSPVNCTALAYINARAELDAQRDAWIATATGEIVSGVALGSSLPGPAGTPVNTPLLFAQPDGFSVSATPVDLLTSYGFNSGSNNPGTPSFANVQINGSPSGCTMQDNAPKASSSAAGDFYFNQLNNLSGLNAVRFTFSTPVQAFGAFFGDLETSYRGTTAFMRLLDANGALIADLPINSTLGLAGGVVAENAQCSQTNVPGVDVAAQGLLPGCGNAATRWVGFVSSLPVAQALVVVGDNDPLPGGRGRSERLSFMGPTVVRALPAADIHIRKYAPVSVTAGVPFNYTIVVSNSSAALAAGVVITDVAPTGMTFNAVTGENCNLINDTVTCTVDTLAASASVTISVQATANQTATVTNTAFVVAANDTNFTNNTASATVTPLPALPRNDCATQSVYTGASLIINEIMYRQTADDDEWIELYATVYLPGGAQFFITDNEASSVEYRFLLTVPAGGVAAGTYIVLHSAAGTNDTTLLDGDGLEYFGVGSGNPPYLNNTGDNITLYAGTSTAGTPLDYVAYGSGVAINGPNTGWSLPNAPTAASPSQSIAAIYGGNDTNNGAQWTAAGSSGTLGLATSGDSNNGKLACNVAIVKTGPNTGMVGASFDYVITVSNTTDVTLTGVVVTDTQPVGLTFNSVTGAGCNLAGGSFTCTLGLLLPQASQVITVNAVATSAGVISNTAYTNAMSDTIASDNSDVHAMPFLPPGAIGDFVYLDLNTNGTQDDGEITPLNNVPITLTYADGRMTSTLTVDGFYLFPNLPSGIYTVTVGSAPGYLLTSAPISVITLAESQIYTSADFGFIYATVDLEIAKHGVAQLLLGDAFPYTLVVTNQSATVPALDVVLTDTQPLGITFNAVSDPRCALFAGDVTCNLGNISALGVETVIITSTATTVGVWVNTAAITATNESHVVDNRAAFTTTVTSSALQNADLQLNKMASQSQVTPGDLLTYTLVLTNLGPGNGWGVQVEDRLPAGLIYQSSSAQQGVYNANSGLWDIGAVAPNTSAILTIMTLVDTLACSANGTPACPTTAILPNCAEVSHSDVSDPNSTPGNNAPGEDDYHCVDVTVVTYDWSDNPDPADGVGVGNYSTRQRDNGPRHQIVPGLYLGITVDGEGNGQPTVDADGDDLIGTTDDEDGVTFPVLLAGSLATVNVQVTNATGIAAYVNGFIDWNGDGDFADADEVVIALVTNGFSGVVDLLFNVPLDVANAQNVGTRFRLSTDPNLGPNGPATDGEVEDYLVTVRHFDLALIKRLATDQSATVHPGEAVTFTMTIQNQGQLTATGVTVIDYLPSGFSLYDHDWAAAPNHTAIYTLPTLLAPGAQATVDISLLVDTTLATGVINVAEISRADNDNDPNNAPPVDIDSTPDATVDNDGTPKDDVTSEDGKHLPTDDEDDHDLAHVTVQPLVAVGNSIWNDANGDGIQQQGEPLLPGVIVELLLADGLTPATDANNNPVAPVITAADGRYLFAHLLPGDYVIKVTPPVGYLPTVGGADPDNNDNDDSNGLPGDAVQSLPVTLSSGDEPIDDGDISLESNLSVDFGFYLPVTVGDRVWYDYNGDGAQATLQANSTAELGVPGVSVSLYNAATRQMVLLNGNPAITATDSHGLYLFDRLPPGEYYVIFGLDTLPSAYLATIPNVIDVTEADNSDADPTTGQTRNTGFLAGGSKDLDLDLGIYQAASIGNYAWFDLNKDGLKDDNEPGVAGITVNLYNVQGNLVATTLTDRDGYFQFAGLTPGDYYLAFIPPPNYTFTVPNMDGEFNSDADPNNGRTVLTTLAPGENDPSWGVGFISPALGEDEVTEPEAVNYLYLPWITQ